MKINLMYYRNLKDIIDRFVQKEHNSYKNKLSWPADILSLYTRSGIYSENKLKYKINNEMLHHINLHIYYNYPATLNNAIMYESFNQNYYTLSNVLNNKYDCDCVDCANGDEFGYNYDDE